MATYFAKWKTKQSDRSALSIDGFTTIRACVYPSPEEASMPRIVIFLDKDGKCHAEQTDLLHGEDRAKQLIMLEATRQGVDFEFWDTKPHSLIPPDISFDLVNLP